MHPVTPPDSTATGLLLGLVAWLAPSPLALLSKGTHTLMDYTTLITTTVAVARALVGALPGDTPDAKKAAALAIVNPPLQAELAELGANAYAINLITSAVDAVLSYEITKLAA